MAKKCGRRIDYISAYNFETDELVTIFDSYDECALYFETSKSAIICNVSRGIKKSYKGKWYILIPEYKK